MPEDESNATETRDEPQSMDWKSARDAGMKMRHATKTYVLEVADEEGDVTGVLEFQYGQLSPQDQDRIQEKGVSTTVRGGQADTKINRSAMVSETLKRGIKEGPVGFSCTNQQISEFMEAFPDHSKELADCISDFSQMDPEVRVKFRQVGVR